LCAGRLKASRLSRPSAGCTCWSSLSGLRPVSAGMVGLWWPEATPVKKVDSSEPRGLHVDLVSRPIRVSLVRLPGSQGNPYSVQPQ
jgi:hypothetical protein